MMITRKGRRVREVDNHLTQFSVTGLMITRKGRRVREVDNHLTQFSVTGIGAFSRARM